MSAMGAGSRLVAVALVAVAFVTACTGNSAAVADSGAEGGVPADAQADVVMPADAGADAPPACPDAGAPSLDAGFDWLDDTCLWRALPEPAKCDAYEARLPTSRFPKRAFTSCGDGCRVAQLGLDPDGKYAGLWRGYWDSQASYVRVRSFVDHRWVNDVLDVTHNVTLAATQTRTTSTLGYAQCNAIDTRSLGPDLVETWRRWSSDPNASDQTATTSFARVRYRESASYQVLDGAFKEPDHSLFDIDALVTSDNSWGYLVAQLFASTSLDQVPPLPAVAPAPHHSVTDLTAWSDVYVWRDDVDGSAPHRIHTWAPATGYRVLYQSPDPVRAVAIGSSGVVWLSGTYSDAAGATTGTSLWWLPDPGSSAPPELVASQLAIPVFPTGIVTGEGLAAFIDCRRIAVTGTDPPLLPDECALRVVDLASGTVHTYGPPTPSTFWANVAVINARELVVGEIDRAPYDDNQGTSLRLFVLDTTRLDELESVFPAPPADAGP